MATSGVYPRVCLLERFVDRCQRMVVTRVDSEGKTSNTISGLPELAASDSTFDVVAGGRATVPTRRRLDEDELWVFVLTMLALLGLDLENWSGTVNFRASLKQGCPSNGGDDNTAPLDSTTASFDTDHFKALLEKKGLLHSDQELFKGDGSDSDNLVQHYANNPKDFAVDFGASLIKMGNMKPLTGSGGEIRLNCRKIN
uniref:peroxidase-like n=1 Tax=Fragaria vesca subsp. vesca TaxID=101020 RepID=UPI0005CA8CA9|nr:PREDICTED: peroxidase-like [Fragaria vesca subsp. vesca]